MNLSELTPPVPHGEIPMWQYETDEEAFEELFNATRDEYGNYPDECYLGGDIMDIWLENANTNIQPHQDSARYTGLPEGHRIMGIIRIPNAEDRKFVVHLYDMSLATAKRVTDSLNEGVIDTNWDVWYSHIVNARGDVWERIK